MWKMAAQAGELEHGVYECASVCVCAKTLSQLFMFVWHSAFYLVYVSNILLTYTKYKRNTEQQQFNYCFCALLKTKFIELFIFRDTDVCVCVCICQICILV